MHIIGEHYHVYNRGAHKAPIFHDKDDYDRFVSLLYIKNDVHRVDLRNIKPSQMFIYNREVLVDIFAYCLMPNHFHIGLKEITEKGIEKFVHKLCTSYTMYYNNKYDHSGTILQGQYKSKLVDSDEYLRYLIQYIHLNPFGIEEPDLMKTAKPEYLKEAIEFSKKYEYSSYKDYLGEKRPQNSITRVGLSTQAYPA
jgi:putative transposase